MKATDHAVVVARFFEAINLLIENKVIRGLKTITDLYGLNRWNVVSLSKNHNSGIFDVAWVVYLCRDFKFSPVWFILGEGSPLLVGWTLDDVKIFHEREKNKKNI